MSWSSIIGNVGSLFFMSKMEEKKMAYQKSVFDRRAKEWEDAHNAIVEGIVTREFVSLTRTSDGKDSMMDYLYGPDRTSEEWKLGRRRCMRLDLDSSSDPLLSRYCELKYGKVFYNINQARAAGYFKYIEDGEKEINDSFWGKIL